MATTTAPPQQQPPQQDAPSDAALIALIVAAFLALHSVHAIVSRLRKPFSRAGIGSSALKAGVAVVLSMPQQPMEGTGPATRWAVQTNELRRAAFTLASVRRIQRAADEAKAQGQPVIDAIQAAVARERTWFSAHVSASQGRVTAAMAVDGMASAYGNLLGWNAVKDPRCTPECRAADGKNFHADRPPLIGFPGATHPNCRCFPSAPFRGAPVLP